MSITSLSTSLGRLSDVCRCLSDVCLCLSDVYVSWMSISFRCLVVCRCLSYVCPCLSESLSPEWQCLSNVQVSHILSFKCLSLSYSVLWAWPRYLSMSLRCLSISLRCPVYVSLKCLSVFLSQISCLSDILYGVATISRLLKMKGLFCRISSVLYGSFPTETYNFKEPTNRSHPIACPSNVCRRLSDISPRFPDVLCMCVGQRCVYVLERWGAGVDTQKNVLGEIGGWGRVPFNEPYAPLLSTIYDGA